MVEADRSYAPVRVLSESTSLTLRDFFRPLYLRSSDVDSARLG